MFIGDQAEETACNINSVVLENGGSFQYLERDIANSNNDKKTVEKLISKDWNAYNKVKAVLKDRKTRVSMEKTVFYVWCRNKNMEKKSTQKDGCFSKQHHENINKQEKNLQNSNNYLTDDGEAYTCINSCKA